jgi:hypothetical protein
MRYQWLGVCTAASLTFVVAPTPALAQSQPQPTITRPQSQPAVAQAQWRPELTKAQWQPAITESRFRIGPAKSSALKWELAFLALSAVDAVQTIECLNRNACEEANPLFGKRPSTKTIILTKVGGGLAHFALFTYLNDRNPKMALRAAQVSVALQGTVVLLNARVAF